MVLIQGTGAVRAGIWARSVCINEDFNLGSMIPQVKWANEKNIPVLIMNPNHSIDNDEPVPTCQNMGEHAIHVWRNYVLPSGF